MPRHAEASTSAVLTLPNLFSLTRIAAIPIFVWLILNDGTEAAGIVVFGVVAATDWVDGYLARATGRVTELGKILDPVADRLAIVSLLVALVVRDLFPLWAALLIAVRDVTILLVGGALLATRGVRVDVRRVGKVATLALMLGVPWIAWGELDAPLSSAASVVGWCAFAVGIVLYYAAAGLYATDVRRALIRAR